MPNKPSASKETRKPERRFLISGKPDEFDMEEVYEVLLNIIKLIKEGKTVGGNNVCKCSIFPLVDVVHSAIRGDIFDDICGTDNPEGLAKRLAFHLWGEVVRIHTTQTLADRRYDG